MHKIRPSNQAKTMTKRFLFAVVLLLSISSVHAQWLDVVSADLPPYNVPAQLIRDHLTGPGIEILDVQYDGKPHAVGYFTGGDSAIGLRRGLLLTTGRSLSADGLGMDFSSDDNDFDLLDPDLGGQTTGPMFDLTRYRITFRASADSIRFRYVFASEEYPEFACSAFNDVFGFFLQGPGYPVAVNIARVPGTNLPVTINNVHPANGPGCAALHAQYYNNNNNSVQQPVYDGLLDVFIAEAAVQPCGIYTMTLALADVSDGAYDSGVFLEAKSFGSAASVVASFEPGSAVLPENALADTVHIRFMDLPAALLPMTVTLGGTAQNGLDYQPLDSIATITTTDTVLYWLVQPLPDSLSEQFETVVLTVRDTACFFRTFTLYIADPDPEFQSMDTVLFANVPVLLSAPAPTALTHLVWSFSNYDTLAIAPVNALVYSGISVSAGTVPILGAFSPDLLESVCINIQHTFDADLDFYLIAPNGQFLELSTDNGHSGDDYTNTCFSSSTTTPITSGLPFAPASAAPFTGSFQPEGDWDDLLGAPMDGVWQLALRDDAPGFAGQLLDWTLNFSGAQLGDFHYLWTTGDTTKTLSATEPGIYRVKISNDVGAVTKTFFVLNACSVFTQSAATICPGETYVFAGNALATSGLYHTFLPAANGCDTVLTLVLTVLPVSADSLLVVLPPGGSFSYNGQTLTEAGSYAFVLQAANGCDSTMVITLTFTSATHEPKAVTTVHFSPNPALGETLISWDNALHFSQLRVFDVHGRLAFSQRLSGADSAPLKTAGWAAGWYAVHLEGRDGARAWGRLLVRR